MRSCHPTWGDDDIDAGSYLTILMIVWSASWVKRVSCGVDKEGGVKRRWGVSSKNKDRSGKNATRRAAPLTLSSLCVYIARTLEFFTVFCSLFSSRIRTTSIKSQVCSPFFYPILAWQCHSFLFSIFFTFVIFILFFFISTSILFSFTLPFPLSFRTSRILFIYALC